MYWYRGALVYEVLNIKICYILQTLLMTGPQIYQLCVQRYSAMDSEVWMPDHLKTVTLHREMPTF